MSADNTDNTLPFEQSLQQLEQIVAEIEQGDLSLNDALSKFEKGIALAKSSQQALESAEQKVSILMQSSSGEKLEDLDLSSQESGDL